MRVAALYDIHGNLPALEAVLADVHEEDVDLIVVGGDVLPGPMPRETLALLRGLDVPVRFLYGNGELSVLARIAAGHSGQVAYWGTPSGQPLPQAVQDVIRWTARQLDSQEHALIQGWPGTIELEHPELGSMLFCHGTPWSETDVFTRLTPDEPLIPVFEGVSAALVVCGHTHMQFDRMVAATRVVNAGSVGMPFGNTGAYWLLIDRDIQLRHTRYDLARAADRVRATQYPQAEEFAAKSILEPPSEDDMARAFASVSFGTGTTPSAPKKSL
jgi:predicted phosphodiesterase